MISQSRLSLIRFSHGRVHCGSSKILGLGVSEGTRTSDGSSHAGDLTIQIARRKSRAAERTVQTLAYIRSSRPLAMKLSSAVGRAIKHDDAGGLNHQPLPTRGAIVLPVRG